jgi:hypothetical protein
MQAKYLNEFFQEDALSPGQGIFPGRIKTKPVKLRLDLLQAIFK